MELAPGALQPACCLAPGPSLEETFCLRGVSGVALVTPLAIGSSSTTSDPRSDLLDPESVLLARVLLLSFDWTERQGAGLVLTPPAAEL